MSKKNALAQYTDLIREIREVKERIEKTEAEIRKLEEEGVVTDMVKGGEGGIQHFSITGFPYGDYSKKKTLLYTRKSILHSLESEIEQSLNDVHEFVAGLEDSRDRRIVTMRVIDKMSWKQIAICMGGGNTAEGVRQIYHRLLEHQK